MALGVSGSLEWRVNPGGFVSALTPHTSGMNRWWNSPEHHAAGKKFFRDLLRPCILIEGADGAGKTTLHRYLLETTALDAIPSEDPPKTQEECLDRVNLRARPGVVCDRSSGLLSELVYAPVLRGGTLGPEEWYWDLVRAIVHATVFIYCRPRRFQYDFRPGESEEHVQGVREKHGAIVERYDYVMTRVSALGGRVVRYDWERDNPSEVMECVG